MRGIEWRPLQLPLAAGLNQKADDRALPPPTMASAIDVQFEETGGLQTRRPYTALGSTTATGTAISTARRLYANGNELVMFTKDSVYSWNDQLNRWVFRATHMAVASEERTVYATPGDQYECDRAELSGIVFYAWTDADVVYMAATDKASGAVLLAPTAVSGTATRPRLVAVSSRVLLFFHAGTDSVVGSIKVMAFDPTATNPSTWSATLGGSGVTVLAAANSGAYYDVTRILTTATVAFVARRAVTTSYEIASVTDASTPVVTASTKARTCDGPIAVSSDPTGATVQVIRANGTNIQGDRITVSGLADAATGQAVGTVAGTPVSQICCAHRSVQDSGAYRCYVFWTASETSSAGAWLSKYNYVDTGGAIGTQANFVRHLGIASRAFDHEGSIYFWGVFAGESSFSGASPSSFRAQLQNTFFLYRDDATLHAKAASTRAGGLSPSVGRLPGVALTSGTTTYSWCGTERRIISIGSSGAQKGFDKRAPRDITFTFDSNDARRCVRLGETLYVSGAEILQYDGVGLYEVGFHLYPWYFGIIEVAAGSVEDGTYTYKITWRWENAKGELDRSTTATHGNVTIAAGPNGGSIVTWYPLYQTHKTTTKPIAVEVWRTAKNPGDGAPFYLVSSKDPASLTNPNRYVPNDPTATGLPTFNDEMADATATTKETNPENGDVLENLAPPGASVIAATDTRVFLGGVAGDPDRIWYSKLRQAGQVASFHDTLTFDVPKDGGDITGIAFLNGICVVFRETATYMFPGEGYDNLGRGSTYGPPQVVSYDVGCRDTDSIVNTPEGIAFQSAKGKYLLTRGWTMKPIGLPVVDYDSETVLAAHVVPKTHQVRFLTASRMLVWDYLIDQWAEWTITDGVHAAVWNSTYHYLSSAEPKAERTSYVGATYGLDVTTAWIKPADLQGAVAIRNLLALGEYSTSSAHHLAWFTYYDYDDDTIVDETYTALGSTSRGLQLAFRPSRQKCEAIKLRLKVYGAATQATLATSADVPVLNPAGFWSATFTARELGTLGNGITVSVAVTVDSTATTFIDVRDHQTYSAGAWSADTDNVGIHVITSDGTVLMTAIEAAINAYSDLLSVTTSGGATRIDHATIGSSTISISSTSGGAFASPSTHNVKLTGLGMEVGVYPHLYKRISR